jgi:exonuclease III
MATPNKVVSWNLNSVWKKFPYLQLLLEKYNPLAFCLQETKLDPNEEITIKNYTLHRFEPQEFW